MKRYNSYKYLVKYQQYSALVIEICAASINAFNKIATPTVAIFTRVCLKNYSGSVEIVHFNQITVVAIHKIAR